MREQKPFLRDLAALRPLRDLAIQATVLRTNGGKIIIRSRTLFCPIFEGASSRNPRPNRKAFGSALIGQALVN